MIVDVVVLLVLVPLIGWTGAAFAKVLGYFAQLILVARAYRMHEPEGERMHWILGRSDIDFLTGWVRLRLARRKA